MSVGHPQPYETVISEFHLSTAFQTYFAKADVPLISGLTLGVDTARSGDGGTAAAYIHRIEFLEQARRDAAAGGLPSVMDRRAGVSALVRRPATCRGLRNA